MFFTYLLSLLLRRLRQVILEAAALTSGPYSLACPLGVEGSPYGYLAGKRR